MNKAGSKLGRVEEDDIERSSLGRTKGIVVFKARKVD